MVKFVIPIVVVIVLGIGGFFLYQNFQTEKVSQPTIEPTSVPIVVTDPCEVLTKGSTDVPPLYSSIQWQQPKITEEDIIEYDENYSQSTQVLSGCVVQASGIDPKLAKVVTGGKFSQQMGQMVQLVLTRNKARPSNRKIH